MQIASAQNLAVSVVPLCCKQLGYAYPHTPVYSPASHCFPCSTCKCVPLLVWPCLMFRAYCSQQALDLFALAQHICTNTVLSMFPLLPTVSPDMRCCIPTAVHKLGFVQLMMHESCVHYISHCHKICLAAKLSKSHLPAVRID